MLYLYDKAIEEKLKKLFPRVVYAPVDKFYSRYLEAENNTDAPIKLPAISFWRISHEFNSANALPNMRAASMSKRRYTDDEIRQIYSMEIPLTYQLDIWANSDIDRDDLFSELVYALTLYPNISIVYDGIPIQFALQIQAADDITDVAQFEDTGDLYRIAIPILIPSARLFFYKDVKMCKYINVNFDVNDMPDGTIGTEEQPEQNS